MSNIEKEIGKAIEDTVSGAFGGMETRVDTAELAALIGKAIAEALINAGVFDRT